MEFQDTVASGDEYVHEFAASWRSTLGSLVILLLVIVFPLLLVTVLGLRQGVSWGMTASVMIIAWLIWLFGRPLIGRTPALSVSRNGLAYSGIRSATLLWRDIADIREESVQGQTQIVVSLLTGTDAPVKKSWWKSAANEKRIPLGLIKTKDHAAVVVAVANGFATYGGDGAVRAMQVRQDELQRVADLEARLKRLTPVTWGLYLMVALNVGVWFANIGSGMSVIKPLPSELLAWGANSASSVVLDHQYWRLLTATFLHGGLIHMALNMLGLWSGGQQLNRLHGDLNFLLIYFGSALTGSALSLHFSAQQSVSVGASGAVFGVLGALFVTMYKYRGQISSLTSKNVLTSQGVFLVYALGLGFGKQGIDNAAHFGGLVAGSLLAWLLVGKVNINATHAQRKLVATTGVLLSTAVVVGLVITTPTPEVHHRQLFEFQAVFTRILPGMQATEKSFHEDAKAAKDKKMSESQFSDAIEAKHLPAYRRVESALAPLDIQGTDPTGENFRDIKRVNSLMVKLLEIQVKSSHDHPGTDDPVAEEQAKAIGIEIGAINARLGERLKPAKAKR